MTSSKKMGRFARAWLSYCGHDPDLQSAGGPSAEDSVLIDRRPPPPVAFATDTIIGWQFDPSWLD